MRIVAGLGNPGPKHARHRHNVGFMVADEIAARHGLDARRARHHAHVADGRIGGERVLLLKPQTFMNDSGRSLAAALRFRKLKARDAIVIYDEIDLVPGKVRAKIGGGHAGHNGVRSIASHIGPDFWRVRIGVGHPGDARRVERYVLSDFPKADEAWVSRVAGAVADSLPILLGGDEAGFMTRVALLAPPPGPAGDGAG